MHNRPDWGKAQTEFELHDNGARFSIDRADSFGARRVTLCVRHCALKTEAAGPDFEASREILLPYDPAPMTASVR